MFPVKRVAFTGAVLVLLTSFFFVSCSNPADSTRTVNARQPTISVQPASTFWNVFTAKDGVKLTVEAAVSDGGQLSYQWYSNSNDGSLGSTEITAGGTSATLSLAKADYTANGDYYFYVIVTNTISDSGKTANKISDVATVTIVGYPDTDYSDTYTLPSKLIGEWESEYYGEIYTISAEEFSSGMDWGEGWSGYKGTIVNHRSNAEGTAGYITIQYTQNDWDKDAEGLYYVLYYSALTDTTVTIAGAGSFTFTDPDFGLSGGRTSKDEAEATYTVSAGYFAFGSDLVKAESVTHLTVDWELNGGEWETGSRHPGVILSGTALAKPSPDPFKDWYTFAGWYSDESLTTEYDFTSTVTVALHLYAKWEEAFWRITWHLNDGAWGSSQTPIWRADKGTVFSKPSPDPAKDGYIFAGWYTDVALTTAYNFSANVTASLNLYAKWNPNQASVLAAIKAELQALSGGATAAAAVDYKVPAALNLDDNNWEGWLGLLQAIWDVQPAEAGGPKYLNLDLSDCTMTGEVFNFQGTNNGGGTNAAGNNPKSRIVSITLPTAAKRIQSSTGTSAAFNFFTSLKSITGKEIITIDTNACNGRGTLTTVDFPKAVTIGANAFQSTGLTSISLPEATTFSGDSTFQGCTALASVDLPKATGFTGSTFSGCTNLTTVNLPKAVTFAGSTFNGCTNMVTLSLPEATTFGGFTFNNCSKLATVNLPKVATLGNQTFGNTTGTALTIIMGSSAPVVGTTTFTGITAAAPKTVTVKVPSGATGYGSSPNDTTAENWGNGFRGRGWTGTAFTNATTTNMNANVTLTIEYE